MIQLNRNRFLVLNYPAETFLAFDDPLRLISFLIGKRTGHLVIVVLKGDRAKFLTVDNDLATFSRTLNETMAAL